FVKNICTDGRIRTVTGRVLNALPLPVGLRRQGGAAGGVEPAPDGLSDHCRCQPGDRGADGKIANQRSMSIENWISGLFARSAHPQMLFAPHRHASARRRRAVAYFALVRRVLDPGVDRFTGLLLGTAVGDSLGLPR